MARKERGETRGKLQYFDTEQADLKAASSYIHEDRVQTEWPSETKGKQINEGETSEYRNTLDASKDERGGDEGEVMKRKKHMGKQKMSRKSKKLGEKHVKK